MTTTTPNIFLLAEEETLVSMVPRTEDRPFLRFWTKTVVLPREFWIEVDGQRLFEYELEHTSVVPGPFTMVWKGVCAPVNDLDDQYVIATEQAFPDLRHRIVGIRPI